MKSIDILVIVVLGGMGNLSGSGSYIACHNFQLSTIFCKLRMVIYAVLLNDIRPQGLMGTKEFSLSVIFRKRKPHAKTVYPDILIRVKAN